LSFLSSRDAQCHDEEVEFVEERTGRYGGPLCAFGEELNRALPEEIPHRERLIAKAAQHLRLIAAANEHMNLTRLTSPEEAAIKHVCDSVAPWHHFTHARRVMDAGTGAGFPGIPLSIVLPDIRFTLVESTQKKARFVDAAVESLELGNVRVVAARAEAIALLEKPDIITARAIAPLHRILDLFAKPLREGARLILYKGPDIDAELAEANAHRVSAEVLCRYDLPRGFGSRTLVCVRRSTLSRAQRLIREHEPSGDESQSAERSDRAECSDARNCQNVQAAGKE
jgi:16S rRNA (guanine527-N7)-methyltransferase